MSGLSLDLSKRLGILSFDVGVRHLASWHGEYIPNEPELHTLDWRCDDIMPDVLPNKNITIQVCVEKLLRFFMVGLAPSNIDPKSEEFQNFQNWSGPVWGLERGKIIEEENEHGTNDRYLQLHMNETIDYVFIEMQPNFNTKMKCVSHALQVLCKIMFPAATIHFISAKLKNGLFQSDTKIQDDYKRYSATKKGAVEYVEHILEMSIPISDKKDDLADCFLQALAVVERQKTKDREKMIKKQAAAERREAKKRATAERKAKEKAKKKAEKEATKKKSKKKSQIKSEEETFADDSVLDVVQDDSPSPVKKRKRKSKKKSKNKRKKKSEKNE